MNRNIIDPIIYDINYFENFISLEQYEVTNKVINSYFWLAYNKNIEFLEINNTTTDYYGYANNDDYDKFCNELDYNYNELKSGFYHKWQEGLVTIKHTSNYDSEAIIYFDNIILKCIVDDSEHGYIASFCGISTCARFFDTCQSILN